MRFNLKVTGQNAMRDKIALVAANLRNLPPAFKRAGILMLADAQGKIRSKNRGTWPATAETGFGTSLYRTGSLFRSLTLGDSENLLQQLPGGIRIGTNLKTPDERFNIGLLMQNGVGPIVARNGYLKFKINGEWKTVKRTKGIPARPFLFFDQDGNNVSRVRAVFAAWILRGDITT